MEEVKTYQASSIGCKNDDPSFSKFFPTKDQAVDCLMSRILKAKRYNWADIKNIYITLLNYGVYEFNGIKYWMRETSNIRYTYVIFHNSEKIENPNIPLFHTQRECFKYMMQEVTERIYRNHFIFYNDLLTYSTIDHNGLNSIQIDKDIDIILNIMPQKIFLKKRFNYNNELEDDDYEFQMKEVCCESKNVY